MNVTIGKNIIIHDFNNYTLKFFNDKLTFDNPDFYKKERIGKCTWNIPRTITLMSRRGSDIIIPYGMIDCIVRNKGKFDDIKYLFNDREHFINYECNIKPFKYQEQAINSAMFNGHGVLVAPCGSGKTQIGLAIASKLGGRTLWLTHTHDLLKQSMERAKSCYGLNNKEYGTITNGKVNIGNVITFATIQTMSKIDVSDYYDYWDTVIVDECHHAVGTPTKVTMFYDVISRLQAKHKFGLTATPKRSDGLEPCMFALLGEKFYEISKEDVSCNTCNVSVKKIDTGFTPDIDKILSFDGTLSYGKLLSNITSDTQRNEKIINDIIDSDGTCLVLSDRVAHIEKLHEIATSKGIKSSVLSGSPGSKNKIMREESIKHVRSGKIKVLFATFQLAKEGLDISSLNNVFFATPQKNETVIQQSAGRVARKHDGKKCGYVYDYVDNFGMLYNWSKARDRIYKSLGYEIM